MIPVFLFRVYCSDPFVALLVVERELSRLNAAMILRKEHSRIGLLAVVLLSVLVLAAAKREQQFSGVISDSQCAYNIHSQTHSHQEMLKMHTMGNSEADCVKTCVKIGGSYVLLTKDNKVWQLSDQKTPARFAAQRVVVRGTPSADGKSIDVAAIAAVR